MIRCDCMKRETTLQSPTTVYYQKCIDSANVITGNCNLCAFKISPVLSCKFYSKDSKSYLRVSIYLSH